MHWVDRETRAALHRVSASLAVAAALLMTAPAARGDISHVVQPGHTLEEIANRYQVTVQVIMEANHLKDPGQLKPGQDVAFLVHRGRGPNSGNVFLSGTLP